jgi:hypothetical protein
MSIHLKRFERYTTGEDTFAIEYQKPAKRAGDFSEKSTVYLPASNVLEFYKKYEKISSST